MSNTPAQPSTAADLSLLAEKRLVRAIGAEEDARKLRMEVTELRVSNLRLQQGIENQQSFINNLQKDYALARQELADRSAEFAEGLRIARELLNKVGALDEPTVEAPQQSQEQPPQPLEPQE